MRPGQARNGSPLFSQVSAEFFQCNASTRIWNFDVAELRRGIARASGRESCRVIVVSPCPQAPNTRARPRGTCIHDFERSPRVLFHVSVHDRLEELSRLSRLVGEPLHVGPYPCHGAGHLRSKVEGDAVGVAFRRIRQTRDMPKTSEVDDDDSSGHPDLFPRG